MQVEAAGRRRGDVHIFDITGALTLGPHLHSFVAQTCSELAMSGSRGAVLNLGGLTDIDSAGLGGFLSLYAEASRRGCRLVLACAGPRVRELLKLTHLERVLPCHDTEEAAVAAARGGTESARQQFAQAEVPDQPQQ
ncbi:MAG TPA: STAS domain-containing protein [Bryobacteraceae bacterium]|nr:STAS domain-containing protein [Bryobacteraceae bacterium]